MAETSVNPAGERFAIPSAEEYGAELERIETLAVVQLPVSFPRIGAAANSCAY